VAVSIAVLSLAGTSAFSANEDNEDKELKAQQERGHAIVTKNCAPCHAIERTGTGPRPDTPLFRYLGRRYPVESLEEALGEGIISGHPDMPEFIFTGEDVGAIIAYLKLIQE
jgi:mono/diheme cytochrome c family protein